MIILTLSLFCLILIIFNIILKITIPFFYSYNIDKNKNGKKQMTLYNKSSENNYKSLDVIKGIPVVFYGKNFLNINILDYELISDDNNVLYILWKNGKLTEYKFINDKWILSRIVFDTSDFIKIAYIWGFELIGLKYNYNLNKYDIYKHIEKYKYDDFLCNVCHKGNVKDFSVTALGNIIEIGVSQDKYLYKYYFNYENIKNRNIKKEHNVIGLERVNILDLYGV